MLVIKDIMLLSKLLIIWSICNLQCVHTSSIDIILKNFTYKIHQPDVIKYLNITDQIKNKRKSLRMEGAFFGAINSFDFQLTLARYDGRKPLPLLNVTIDGCRSMNSNSKNRIFKIVMNAILYGDSEFPRKCPIPANKRLYIDQFYVHAEDIPLLGPNWWIIATFSWIMERKSVFILKLELLTKNK